MIDFILNFIIDFIIDFMTKECKELGAERNCRYMKYRTGVYWERGRIADVNQDSVILLQVLTGRGRILLAAVCDGMGGLAEGETASGYVTMRLQEWFYESLMGAIRKKKPFWVIRRSLDRLTYHMQERLSVYGDQEKCGLGTTMTVLLLWERTFLLWHLGDSRVYRLCNEYGRRRNGDGLNNMLCMTRDHVKGKNMLTKCVGSFGYERPDFLMGTLRDEEAMLLCSDGFRHHVTKKELEDALNPGQVREEEQIMRRLQEIGRVCMQRGERDNMSAVYIRTVK